MKRFITFLITFLFIINTYSIFAKAAQAPIDDDTFNKIDVYINSTMETEKIPGMSINIVNENKVIYSKGYGVSDDIGTKVTEETPFLLGSVSTSFTALAIMQLVEQNKIAIDSPVQKYIPWFSLKDEQSSKEITVKNLLTQTSGLPTSAGNMKNFSINSSLEETVKNLKNIELSHSVNSTYENCNLNYIILGYLIETVSQTSYADYIQQHIFNSIDMGRSYTSITKASENGLSTGYTSFLWNKKPLKTDENSAFLPATNLISTSKDMSNYLIAQMNDGKYRGRSIISSSELEKLQSPTVKNFSGSSYCMGWFDYGDTLQLGGDADNFHSDMIINKSQKLGIVVLINANDLDQFDRDSYNIIARDINDILLGKSPEYTESMSRKIINSVFIAEVILSFALLYFFIKWISDLRHGYIDTKKNGFSILILNIALPLVIFIISSKYFDIRVTDIFNSPSDLVLITFLLPLVLIVIGFIKLISLAIDIVNH